MFFKEALSWIVYNISVLVYKDNCENDLVSVLHPGKLFHIDFGYILGRDPKPLPPPMKLNKEMVEGMGGTQSEQYQEFRKQCYTAFLHLRRWGDCKCGSQNTRARCVCAKVRGLIVLVSHKALEPVMETFTDRPFLDRHNGIFQYTFAIYNDKPHQRWFCFPTITSVTYQLWNWHY